MNVDDTHNASHRQLDYFEWWYFHIVTPSGVAINLVIHETDIFGLSAESYVSLTVFIPGQLPRYLKRELPGIPIARTGPGLQVGGVVQETAEALWLDIPFPGQGHLRACLRKRVRPFAPNEGVLYADPQGRRSYWVVNIPWADVTGLLYLDDQVYRLTGWGYQDHQWGNLRIQDFASDWVWGQLGNGETAVVFFQILTQMGQLVEQVGVWFDDEGRGNGRCVGTGLKTDYLTHLLTMAQPEEACETMLVEIPALHSRLTFGLSPAGVMRSRSGEGVGVHQASYSRWAVQGMYEDGRGEQAVYGITEMLRLRPIMLGETAVFPSSTR